MNKKAVFGILIIIVLLGTFLRLYQLDHESLWSDEAYSVHHASQEKISSVLYLVDKTEAAPFGYYLLLHEWIGWFGNSVFSLRALSVLFSLASIVLLFFTAKEIFSDKIALFASFLAAISMLEVLYAQEARLYALFSFLALACTYFFILWYKQEKSPYLYLYAFFMLCCLYVNYLAIFLLAFFFVWIHTRKKKYSKKFFIINIIILVLTFPLWGLIISQFLQLHVGYSALLIEKGIPEALAFLGLFLLVIPLIVVFIASYLILRRLDEIKEELEKQFEKYKHLILVILLVLSTFYLIWSFIPLFIFNSPLTHSIAITRYLLFLSPIIYIFIAWFYDKINSKKLAALFAIGLILVNAIALVGYYDQQTKDPWQQVGLFLEERAKVGEVVLLDKGSISHQFLVEYYTEKQLTIHKITQSQNREGYLQMSLLEIDELLESEDSFFLVTARNSRTTIDYRSHFNQNYILDLVLDLGGVRVYHYQAQS